MKDYKTEDIILGVGTVLLFIAILAALLTFSEWGEETNAIPRIQWQAAANPAASGPNPNPDSLTNPNNLPAGFINIARRRIR